MEGVKHVVVLSIVPVLTWLDNGMICSQLFPLLLVADDHMPNLLVGLGTGWNNDVSS
jgi:hypothetical protein